MTSIAWKLAQGVMREPRLLSRPPSGGGFLVDLLVSYFRKTRRKPMYVTFIEAAAILAVKNPRSPDLISSNICVNPNSRIIIFDRLSEDQSREKEKMNDLRRYKGLDVITASAIFSWSCPSRFAVIDQHSLRALNRYGFHARDICKPCLDDWILYNKTIRKSLMFIRAYYKKYCRSPINYDRKLEPIDIDIWLYNKGKKMELKKIPKRNLSIPERRE